ncbi:hypothetical protein BC831DRAFT_463019 [Entophlyctis helioformis]|nr:hypothetical protein BC831DRAFT_463019 [Entophlyctis helioformis]
MSVQQPQQPSPAPSQPIAQTDSTEISRIQDINRQGDSFFWIWMGVVIGIVVLNILVSAAVFLFVRHRRIRRLRLDIKADRDRRRNRRRLHQLRRKRRSDTATAPSTAASSDNNSNSSLSQSDRDSSIIDIKDGWLNADREAIVRISAGTPLGQHARQKSDDVAVLVEHDAG